jgi:hypothetical protein
MFFGSIFPDYRDPSHPTSKNNFGGFDSFEAQEKRPMSKKRMSLIFGLVFCVYRGQTA